MEKVHHLNIAVHILAGTVALFTGLVAAIAGKGGKCHVHFGSYFKYMMVVIILTGLIGVLVFRRNHFLLVITMLSSYTCFSGIRVIRIYGKRPRLTDYLIPVLVQAAAFYYVYYISSLGLYWSPVIIYSTLGALFLVTFYDLSKFFIPVAKLKKATMYEHSYKMISALSGIASAFSGTVFPGYQPYSQFLPSVIGLACIIVTFIGLGNKVVISATNTVSQQAK